MNGEKLWEEVKLLYSYVEANIHVLENLIKKLFIEITEASETNRENMIVYNVLREQEKNKKYSPLFENYYDKYAEKIAQGKIPSFFKTEIKLNFKVPTTADSINSEEAKRNFMALSDEDKIEQRNILLKTMAIVSARMANIYNRYKNITSDCMTNKHDQMREFIFYAIKYNLLVPYDKQIAFGIDTSSDPPCLEASLPGYTRLSLHFPSEKTCKQILQNINTNLRNNGLSEHFLINDNIGVVNGSIEYPFDKYGETNTGIIMKLNSKKAKIYQKQLKSSSEKQSMDYDRAEIFTNFMYPNLNDKYVFYIAESMEYGLGELEKLQQILKERTDRIQKESLGKDKASLRNVYFKEKITKVKDAVERIELINRFYDAYMETSQIDEKVNIESFLEILKKNGIKDQEINIFYAQNLEFADLVQQIAEKKIMIPKEEFSKRFMKETNMDFIFNKKSKNDAGVNYNHFATIYKNGDTRVKFLILIIVKKEANKNVENKNDKYKKHEKPLNIPEDWIRENSINSLLEEIKKISKSKKEKQEKGIEELFNKYISILKNEGVEDIDSNFVSIFKDLIKAYGIKDEVIEHFKPSEPEEKFKREIKSDVLPEDSAKGEINSDVLSEDSAKGDVNPTVSQKKDIEKDNQEGYVKEEDLKKIYTANRRKVRKSF